MQEFVQALKLEFGETELTVKKLKDKIKELRDSLLGADTTTEEYNRNVKQLQLSQKALDEVMALTKKNATALEGSYDALVQKMALLKKEWRATNDEGRRNELAGQIDAINTELKEMDATTGNYQRNVGNYTNSIIDAYKILKDEIKQARAELLQAEEGTEEYAQAMAKLADAQFRMRDMSEQSRYAVADLGEQLTNVGGIASGIASGFGAIQGAMALVGADTENFEKTMVKLQATIAIVQGMQGLEGLADRVKGLTSAIKIASKSMGKAGWIGVILAVVGAIGSLVWWLKDKNKELDKGEQLINDYNQALKENTTEYSKQVAEITVYNNLATDTNIALEKRLKFAEELVTALSLENTELNKQKALNGELATTIDEVTDALMRQSMAKVALDLVAEEQKKLISLQLDLQQIEQGNIPDGYATNIGKNMPVTKQIKATKEVNQAIDEVKTNIQNVIDVAGKAGADFTSLFEKVETDTKETAKEVKETVTEVKSILDTLKEINSQGSTVDNVTQYYDIEIRKAKINGATDDDIFKLGLDKLTEVKQALEEEFANTGNLDLLNEIAEKEIEIEEHKYNYEQQLREQDKEHNDKVLDEKLKAEEEYNRKKQELISNSIQITQMGLSATSQLLNSLIDTYESNEESMEKNAELIKGLKIASATIETIQGGISAYMSAMSLPFPANIIMGALSASAVVATGMMNIAKIRQVDMTGNSSSTPQFNAPQATTPNTSLYSNNQPFNYTRTLTGNKELEELNSQDNRVYILESDIQASNKRVQVRQSETTF